MLVAEPYSSVQVRMGALVAVFCSENRIVRSVGLNGSIRDITKKP